jgi:hypothetical protein
MKPGGRLKPTRLRKVSDKRREKLRAAGVFLTSTFAPKRPAPAVPPARRLTLAERSGGVCEAQLPDCWGRAVEPHHRITRKDGGRHRTAKARSDRLSNLLDLCRCCHAQVHAYPARSYGWRCGWLVMEKSDPSQRPVLYRGVLSYLGDDGRVESFEKAGT